MNFKFLLVFFSAVILMACGKPDVDLEGVQAPIALKASSTAIFLPGGGGIDYGVLPYKVKKDFIDTYNRPSRAVTFHITSSVDDVIQATNEVFESQEYIVKKGRHKQHQEIYEYYKDGNKFTVAYDDIYREGFSRQVSVFFWHWDD